MKTTYQSFLEICLSSIECICNKMLLERWVLLTKETFLSFLESSCNISVLQYNPLCSSFALYYFTLDKEWLLETFNNH
jgi:hypothetical protein